MKKGISILLCLVLLLTLFVGCSNSSGTEAEINSSEDFEVITWKVQGYTPSGTLYDQYGETLAKKITEMSGGRLVIDWYGAGSIVPVGEAPTAVRDGILDAEFGYSALWSGIDEAFPLFCSTPGTFSDPSDMVTWLYEGGGLELWQEMVDQYDMNAHLVLAGTHDMETFLWSNEPISEIDDLFGKTVRIMPVMGNILANNGVSVAFVSGSEIISSMERNVIDAGEYSIPALDQTFGFQDVAKYYTRPGFHQPTATQELMINQQKWDELPDDLKTIVEEACKANVLEMMTDTTLKNIDSMDYFEKEGITLVQMSDEMMATLQEWTDEYFEEKMAESESFRKIRESQISYLKKVAAYKEGLEIPYPEWAFE